MGDMNQAIDDDRCRELASMVAAGPQNRDRRLLYLFYCLCPEQNLANPGYTTCICQGEVQTIRAVQVSHKFVQCRDDAIGKSALDGCTKPDINTFVCLTLFASTMNYAAV